MQQMRNSPHTEDAQRKPIKAHVVAILAARASRVIRRPLQPEGKTADWLTGGPFSVAPIQNRALLNATYLPSHTHGFSSANPIVDEQSY